MVMSSVITNGNIVMKTINLNFTNQTWTLAVRGKDVCLRLYIYLTRNIRKEILFINAELHQCCRIKE
jgi:hypothetical protein